MAKLYLGCSGFTYKHWRGPFYPEDIPSARWFDFYTQHFSSVELNVTFYHLPKPETFDKWHADSPPHFSFVVKGSRYITHVKKMSDPEEGVERFFSAALHLKEKLKVVLWQFPPTMTINIKRFADFLKVVGRYRIRNVFEFRNESWLVEDIISLCRANNAALCMADYPEFISDLMPTADFVYIRRHGHGGSYDGRYSLEYLQHDADRIRKYLRDNLDVFIYFNNDINAFAPINAAELAGLVH